MADKSVIIIGGGIAGLSVGCYAQMNGYRSQILEMHDRPGGLCTSWTRDGYNINGCIHLLVGCGENSYFYPIWEELGAVQGRQFEYYEDYVSFEGTDGTTFTVYSDIHRLEEQMMNVAPEDQRLIKGFIEGIRGCLSFDPPIRKAPELYGPIDGLGALFKLFPHLGFLRKWFKVSMKDYARRFKSPVMRELFSSLWFPDTPVLFFMMTLSMLHQKSSGYPLGGSLEFSRSIEKRYVDLGGQCQYGLKVSKIMVEHDRAVGIRFEDGTEQRADYVISAADGYTTSFDLLDGQYLNKKIRGYYKRLPIFPPLIYISLGLNQPFDLRCGTSTGLNLPLGESITVAGDEVDRLGIRVQNFDPTAAPVGKTLAKVVFPSKFAYWKPLYEDSERYEAEKEQIAEEVVSVLDNRFPGLANMIEMRDVATPITYYRYTGNWQGSHQGWMLTPETGAVRMKNVLPGLSNFFMVGHWVEPGGGVPTAALSGRNVAQFLCKQDRRPFVTTVP